MQSNYIKAVINLIEIMLSIAKYIVKKKITQVL